MTHELAKQFWRAYIGMASKDGAHVNMLSPAKDFNTRAHAGEFDTLTDDQDYRTEADAEEILGYCPSFSTA